MGKPKDVTYQRFGKLVAIERDGKDNHGYYFWRCKCDCGREARVRVNELLDGRVTSCGYYW